MKRKTDYMPYVTIIAVVAVVAVVLLVLNGNKLSSAGEASRFSSYVTRDQVNQMIAAQFNPTNVFDMINARCEWYATNGLSVGGIIPNTFCDKQGSQQICVDALGVDYISPNGAVEGVVAVDCNENDLHRSLFIRCCNGRPFD